MDTHLKGYNISFSSLFTLEEKKRRKTTKLVKNPKLIDFSTEMKIPLFTTWHFSFLTE